MDIDALLQSSYFPSSLYLDNSNIIDFQPTIEAPIEKSPDVAKSINEEDKFVEDLIALDENQDEKNNDNKLPENNKSEKDKNAKQQYSMKNKYIIHSNLN